MKNMMNLQLFAEGEAAAAGPKGVDVRSHFDSLQRQGAEMAGRYENFDLQRELENPMFFKLTGPQVGLSVEDAYVAMHHRELTRAIAEGARRELSNSIRSGVARPAEHGRTAPAASTSSTSLLGIFLISPSIIATDERDRTQSAVSAIRSQSPLRQIWRKQTPPHSRQQRISWNHRFTFISGSTDEGVLIAALCAAEIFTSSEHA